MTLGGAAPEQKSGRSRRSIESLISLLDPTFASLSIHTMVLLAGSATWCGLRSELGEAMWAPRSISAMNCAPGFDPEFPQLLDKAIPRLYGVTVNGADQQGAIGAR